MRDMSTFSREGEQRLRARRKRPRMSAWPQFFHGFGWRTVIPDFDCDSGAFAWIGTNDSGCNLVDTGMLPGFFSSQGAMLPLLQIRVCLCCSTCFVRHKLLRPLDGTTPREFPLRLIYFPELSSRREDGRWGVFWGPPLRACSPPSWFFDGSLRLGEL